MPCYTPIFLQPPPGSYAMVMACHGDFRERTIAERGGLPRDQSCGSAFRDGNERRQEFAAEFKVEAWYRRCTINLVLSATCPRPHCNWPQNR